MTSKTIPLFFTFFMVLLTTSSVFAETGFLINYSFAASNDKSSTTGQGDFMVSFCAGNSAATPALNTLQDIAIGKLRQDTRLKEFSKLSVTINSITPQGITCLPTDTE